MAFIDSSHHYEPTRKELSCILSHLVDGGWLALHDYFNEDTPGVAQALNELVHGEAQGRYTAYRQDGLAILRATPLEKKEETPVEAKPRWVPDK